MLRPLKETFQAPPPEDLLVGMHSADDAAVWRIDEKRALVVTTDFFTPVVDDPFDYGAIAAANSLSDVYAMGGQPFLALNIAALPPDLPYDVLGEIVRGGAETCRQAGVVIAGGHTIQDKEPKYGLVALGFVEIGHMLTKGGVKAGDRLVLTKPLGFGVTTTALKRDIVEKEDLAEVVGWMKRLNDGAARLAREFNLCAGTDITGFSLLGHAMEMAEASQVGLTFHYKKIPFVSCARKYAEAWAFPGGASDNSLFYGQRVQFAEQLDKMERMLLFDPQTSGGLLLAVPAKKLDTFLSRAASTGQPAWEVGEAVPGEGISVV